MKDILKVNRVELAERPRIFQRRKSWFGQSGYLGSKSKRKAFNDSDAIGQEY